MIALCIKRCKNEGAGFIMALISTRPYYLLNS